MGLKRTPTVNLPQQIRCCSGWIVGKADSEGLAQPDVYSDFVVDGTLNALFATKISFGCLNGNVTEQKLDLFQFASCGVAKACTGPAEVVRR